MLLLVKSVAEWFDKLQPLIKQFEGLRLTVYRDGPGFPTQGWGHLLSRDKTLPLATWPAIDLETAQDWLEKDAEKAKRAVNRLCPEITGAGKIAALTDFAFNLGAGYLEISTLRRRINRGEEPTDPNEFMKWVYAGGIKYAGLVKRRQIESLLYFS